MSRYDGLIIPRSYSEYINKTDAATLQQALHLSGVLSRVVVAGDNKAVTSSAVSVAINKFRDKRIGEIFNSNGYYKVRMRGYYARPLVFLCIGSTGLYDIAMFGQNCTAKLMRLGGTSVRVTYRFTAPLSNAEDGFLFIKSHVLNIALTIFSVALYSDEIGTLENSTEEEYNAATEF